MLCTCVSAWPIAERPPEPTVCAVNAVPPHWPAAPELALAELPALGSACSVSAGSHGSHGSHCPAPVPAGRS
eukprot:5127292-Lingulodinium_polyedra.AAC.1